MGIGTHTLNKNGQLQRWQTHTSEGYMSGFRGSSTLCPKAIHNRLPDLCLASAAGILHNLAHVVDMALCPTAARSSTIGIPKVQQVSDEKAIMEAAPATAAL